MQGGVDLWEDLLMQNKTGFAQKPETSNDFHVCPIFEGKRGA
jgi:hypothetical protein